MTIEFPYRWYWKKYMPDRFGQHCRILATGKKDSVLLEFEDGWKVITIRYGVRRRTK